MNLPFCHFARELYCEEVDTRKQEMPGADKSGSKYSIVKRLKKQNKTKQRQKRLIQNLLSWEQKNILSTLKQNK